QCLPVPGPSISVSPSGVIAPGGAVTIRCQCQCEARRLFLYKDGIKIWELDAAGDGGEFTIPSARQADGGVYTCQSRSRSEPPNWSDPSDIMQIIVVDEGPDSASPLPAPHPARPSWGSLGRWDTPWGATEPFLLYKDGNPNALQDMEPAGDLAEFPIRNVSWRDAGSYSCYYHHKWYPFIWSRPSDPVELVVAGELPGSVSPLPAPHPAGPSGQGHVQGRKQAQGPSNQWVQSTEFLRGAEPSATFLFLFMPLIRGVSAPMGRSEPGSALSPGPSRGDARPGSRDRITGGFPSKGAAAAAGALRPREGGSLAHGELQNRGLSQGMVPWSSLLWGRTMESGSRGCPVSTGPSAEFTPHQAGQLKPKETLGRGPSSVTFSAASPRGPGFSVPSLPHPSRCSF
uniref:Ig-like domain-containing protein n=1 Tax=Terrapene triunguis TaxID=2587831 RepID=A0A674JQH7_9SAUR